MEITVFLGALAKTVGEIVSVEISANAGVIVTLPSLVIGATEAAFAVLAAG